MDTLLNALRRGDETAFEALIEQYQAALLRMARLYVQDQAAAEEVVQETWIAVLRGLDSFEGRSTLKTWLFSIVINRAKTRAQRDGRRLTLSLDSDDSETADERFFPADHPLAGHWRERPSTWDSEEQLLSAETQALIQQAIDALPPMQRQVILLRDVEGWTSSEVCNALKLSESNQRVLLHRARSRVRLALEHYLKDRR